MRGRTAGIGASVAAWLVCAGCGADAEPVEQEPAPQWGVEEYGASPVGSNIEDPNRGWGCDLARCPTRLGEPELPVQTGTCRERGYVLGVDGERELGWSRDVAFNDDGRLARVDDTTYTYGADGRLDEIVEGGEPILKHGYNSAGRLTTRSVRVGGEWVVDVEWEYDGRQRVTRKTEDLSTGPGSVTAYYAYPTEAIELIGYAEVPTEEEWDERNVHDEEGKRLEHERSSPAFGPGQVYVYDEAERLRELHRKDDPSQVNYRVTYSPEGQTAKVEYGPSDVFDDHGVITREDGLITLSVYTTTGGDERPEYVFELEGDSCERAIVGGDGWLELTKHGLRTVCGALPCREDINAPR